MKMCQAFAKNGHDVVLYAPLRNNREPDVKEDEVFDFYGVEKCFHLEWIRVPVIKGLGAIYYGLISAVKSKNMTADLIYGRSLFGCLISTFMKIPVCYEIHHIPSKPLVKLLLKLLISIDRLKKIVVISESLKCIIIESYNLDPDKVLVLPDAADPINSHGVVYDIVSKKPGVMKVGYVGHLYNGRGIELIAEMASMMKDVDFHLVGGLDEDIEKWKAMFSNISNLIFHGFVPHREVGAYLNSFDVLLAPYQKNVSVYGGGKTNTAEWMSPLKIFEYMSAGKPILCSDLPALREILEDGKTAIMLPPDQVNAWVEAFKLIKDDRVYAMKLGKAAEKVFTEKHTWKARAEHFFAKYVRDK